ncbi:hypothetical protein JCM10213_007879 [Rhodosporidiobolus nylandii]
MPKAPLVPRAATGLRTSRRRAASTPDLCGEPGEADEAGEELVLDASFPLKAADGQKTRGRPPSGLSASYASTRDVADLAHHTGRVQPDKASKFRSCDPCSRRREKCDHFTVCGSCIVHGTVCTWNKAVPLYERDLFSLSTAPPTPSQLRKEAADLRERVHDLAAQVGLDSHSLLLPSALSYILEHGLPIPLLSTKPHVVSKAVDSSSSTPAGERPDEPYLPPTPVSPTGRLIPSPSKLAVSGPRVKTRSVTESGLLAFSVNPFELFPFGSRLPRPSLPSPFTTSSPSPSPSPQPSPLTQKNSTSFVPGVVPRLPSSAYFDVFRFLSPSASPCPSSDPVAPSLTPRTPTLIHPSPNTFLPRTLDSMLSPGGSEAGPPLTSEMADGVAQVQQEDDVNELYGGPWKGGEDELSLFCI